MVRLVIWDAHYDVTVMILSPPYSHPKVKISYDIEDIVGVKISSHSGMVRNNLS